MAAAKVLAHGLTPQNSTLESLLRNPMRPEFALMVTQIAHSEDESEPTMV